MREFEEIIKGINSIVWGPVMLLLLVGTGIFLTFRLRFMPWRKLGYAIRSLLSKEAMTKSGDGDVSAFASLMTTLAATIGTGNIVGVATAMYSGGPGALVWMWLAAIFGFSTKFSECMLATKYREKNEKGEYIGGPMYTIKNGFKNKSLGKGLGFAFAFFTAVAALGTGNMSQANSISSAMKDAFHVPLWVTGLVLMVLTLLIVVGGLKSISRVATVIVPAMAVFYVISGLLVVVLNYRMLPSGISMILHMAVHPRAVGGGVMGTVTVTVMNSIRYGIARGVFSNEAGLGSGAIPAAASTLEDPVRNGYIAMTGVFFDTIIVCTITGLAIACSGLLGSMGPDGKPLEGVALTAAAFAGVLGPAGRYIVSIGIVMFAFSTILGWEYYAEKCFEFIFQTSRYNIIYRVLFSVIVYVGSVQAVGIVWSVSDVMNALMAIPNLISLLVLSGVVVDEVRRYHSRENTIAGGN